MEITVSDDRPPIVPILLTGLVAGVVTVLVSAMFESVGVGRPLSSAVAIGFGLLAGQLLKDSVVGAYRDFRGSETDADGADAGTAAGEGELPTGDDGGAGVADGETVD
jgi:hypothetical protein